MKPFLQLFISLGVEGIWRVSTFVPGLLGTDPHKFPGLNEVMSAPEAAVSLSPSETVLRVLKRYILQEVALLVQNSRDLDRKVDKHCWWRAALPLSLIHIYLLSLLHTNF